MKLATEVVTAALRAGVVGALSVATAYPVRAAVSGTRRKMAWVLLALPFLTPVLLVGYAYSNFSLSLVQHATANLVWYTTLLWLKFLPVAAVAIIFTPRAVSEEAVHSYRMVRKGTPLLSFHWSAGSFRAPLTGFAVVWLLAFGEFEMASLMNLKTWTVTLFDAHVGGLPITESVWLAMWPFVCELAVVMGVMWLFRGGGMRPSVALHDRRGTVLGWGVLIWANVFVWGVPAIVVLRGTIAGFGVLVESFALSREIVTSVMYGAAAALGAYLVAGVGLRKRVAVLLIIPGLLGALVLAMLLGRLVQTTGFVWLRDTPVPLVVALVFLLMPLAVLLRLLLRMIAPSSAIHAARLLGGKIGRRIIGELKTRRELWVVFVLFCGGYFDLTASAILAPIGVTPVTLRLYNLMHYGRTAVLSAMVCAAMVAPVLVGAVLRAAGRFLPVRR